MTKQQDDTTQTHQSGATREHLFWAREFIQLAKTQARQKGVSDQVLAQAMLVNAWMLFTGRMKKIHEDLSADFLHLAWPRVWQQAR